VVLAAVALCVVFPLLLVALQSLQVRAAGPAGPATAWTAGGRPWASPASARPSSTPSPSPSCASSSPLPLAVLVALAPRPDRPARGAPGSSFAFWAAFFLPPFTVTLSWILLLDPEYGLVNTALARLPFVTSGPFNIYSFWGIVWVHVLTGSLTVKVILLTPAFRNMNAAFEEASRVAGGGHAPHRAPDHGASDGPPRSCRCCCSAPWCRCRPSRWSRCWGLPFRFFVFSTTIYDLLVTRVPPLRRGDRAGGPDPGHDAPARVRAASG